MRLCIGEYLNDVKSDPIEPYALDVMCVPLYCGMLYQVPKAMLQHDRLARLWDVVCALD
jgi:hypothetical protein